MATFTNAAMLLDLRTNNESEFLKWLKRIFECFDSFSQKSEEIGKFKIDQWAQIQSEDGTNAIINVLSWTETILNINVGFPIFNNVSVSIEKAYII